ncbi:MAG: hypothetical protein RLZZ458_2630 [Planctomycetota bacterium]
MEVIGWRLRADLEIHASGRGMWVLKDPLRLAYFQMSDAELSFLRRAGDDATLEHLSAELSAEHPDIDWSLGELQRFLAGAVRAGLMCAAIPGNQRRIVNGVRSQTGLMLFLRWWWSLVSFRWRAFDPDPLLRRLEPLTAILLQPLSVLFALLLVMLAMSLAVVQADVITSELPEISRLLAPENLLLMTSAMIIVRGLHELGHAMVCRYFGGECRELGVQLTLLVPFPYCDVSDSWLWSSRWKRMATAGAGMVVEFITAALCMIVWTCTYPGLLHSFCLNVMLLCSLNTLLVNGNPLLRYDGYYLLSDLCGVPNLAEAGNEEAVGWFHWLFTGQTSAFAAERSFAARFGLVLYGISAGIYRLIITVGLLTVLYQMLAPTGLGLVAVFPGILAPGLSAWGQLRRTILPLWSDGMTWKSALRLLLPALLFAVLFLVPFSIPLYAPFVLTPGNAVPVYVKAGGRLDWVIESGSRVESGDVLARLWNGDLDLDIAEAEGEVRKRTAAAAGLRLRQLEMSDAGGGISAAEELLESARKRLAVLRAAREELTIRSPRSGIVFPPRQLPQQVGADTDFGRVFNDRSGLQLAIPNTWLEPQSELCTVGERSEWRATVCIRQADTELLAAGGSVSLRFDSRPMDAVAGVMELVSGTALNSIPPELTLTQRIPANAQGLPANGDVWYPADVRFSAPADAGNCVLFSTGTALVDTRPSPLWRRLRRLAGLTFTWPF